jgi:threonine synthase
VPFAAVIKLKNAGRIGAEVSIVCILTGSGLKYTAAFAKHDLKSEKCSLDDLSGFIAKNY